MSKLSYQRGLGGEEDAKRYLLSLGYEIIECNFRVPGGEIDIIAQDGDEIVFIEVKSYSEESMTPLHESITAGKRRRMIMAAKRYLDTREEKNGRFDVILIDGSSKIDHIQRAFDANP
ncbi:MAG: YraN family protein [bacterium]